MQAGMHTEIARQAGTNADWKRGTGRQTYTQRHTDDLHRQTLIQEGSHPGRQAGSNQTQTQSYKRRYAGRQAGRDSQAYRDRHRQAGWRHTDSQRAIQTDKPRQTSKYIHTTRQTQTQTYIQEERREETGRQTGR